MATRRATARLILEQVPDAGETPTTMIDTRADPHGALALSGFKKARVEELVVPAGAADQPFLFTDAAAVVLYSDQPFDLRVTAGETLLEDLRLFVLWSDGITHGVHQTSVLLSGNASTEARVTATVFEKFV